MALKMKRRIAGKDLILETGKLAKQAHGSVLVTYGESVVLSTAVAEDSDEMPDFFPLTVDYRENLLFSQKTGDLTCLM